MRLNKTLKEIKEDFLWGPNLFGQTIIIPRAHGFFYSEDETKQSLDIRGLRLAVALYIYAHSKKTCVFAETAKAISRVTGRDPEKIRLALKYFFGPVNHILHPAPRELKTQTRVFTLGTGGQGEYPITCQVESLGEVLKRSALHGCKTYFSVPAWVATQDGMTALREGHALEVYLALAWEALKVGKCDFVISSSRLSQLSGVKEKALITALDTCKSSVLDYAPYEQGFWIKFKNPFTQKFIEDEKVEYRKALAAKQHEDHPVDPLSHEQLAEYLPWVYCQLDLCRETNGDLKLNREEEPMMFCPFCQAAGARAYKEPKLHISIGEYSRFGMFSCYRCKAGTGRNIFDLIAKVRGVTKEQVKTEALALVDRVKQRKLATAMFEAAAEGVTI
jgi:hypothetical protein